MSYLPRIADGELTRDLAGIGAVLIEGVKGCGKTSTAQRQAASVVRMDTDAQARALFQLAPAQLLDREPPLLLDEWQFEPAIWNHVRRAVDDRGIPGQFILTGSATPSDEVRRHSGAGRFGVMRMRPLSLFEAGHTTAEVSLASVLSGEPVRARDAHVELTTLIELLCIGGWPALHGADVERAQAYLAGYLDNLAHIDVPSVAGVRRDPAKVTALVTSLARNTATQAAITTIAADMAGADGSADRQTVTEHLAALERLHVVEQQPAFSGRLRSGRTLRRTPTRHLVDPSLAVAALGASPQALLDDLNTFGLLFESLVIRDLRILSQPLGGQVLHYRDERDLEVDAVVLTRTGQLGAFEVKLGAQQIDAAAASLLRFAEQVTSPVVLGVITNTDYAYTRADGVRVLPIASLAP